ncbi:MAG: anthranilate synthase component II [Bacillota bacterium]
MILVIDNYDSFTYNLVQYIGEMVGKKEIVVYRNDQIIPAEINVMAPDKIVLSPGPGNPDGAGNCLDIVRDLNGSVPLLGVCLGHQVIGQAYGGEIISARKLMHGKVSQIAHNGREIFKGTRPNFKAARYHSLVVDAEKLPPELLVTATSEDGEIMGLKHTRAPVWGIQFHPESILTEDGKKIIKNFLEGEGFKNEDYGSYCCSRSTVQSQ